jgi:hypothetical protein
MQDLIVSAEGNVQNMDLSHILRVKWNYHPSD